MSDESKKDHISNTYSYLFASAKWAQQQAVPEDFPGYSLYKSMSVLTFLAMTVEAFLNHCGLIKISWWKDAERNMNTLTKMHVICELAGISVDKGIEPFQSILKLHKFRNQLAHGKSRIKKAPVVNLATGEISGEEEWVTFTESADLVSIQSNVEAFCQKIWDSFGFNAAVHPNPFGQMGGPIENYGSFYGE
jgi:hypothetical protein